MWFKVDDKFHQHSKVRKVLAEEPAALALWVVAGSWSSDNLQDGFVPDHQLQWLLPARADELAHKLVTARLWRRVRGGYQFHDFADWNKTKEEVLALREARAEAGRKGGVNSGDTRSNGQASASANAEAKTKQKRTQTRPDQTESSSNSHGDPPAPGFDEIWSIYPFKRGGRQGAEKAYAKALKQPGVTHNIILAGVQAYRDECVQQQTQQRYVAHAATWLNNGRWDEFTEPAELLEQPELGYWQR